MYFFMLSFCVLWVFGDCISNDSRWHLLSLFPKCWAGPADAAAAQPGVNWWLMEWGYLIRLPKNTYKYILLYPAHMFLTVGRTLGIRVPVVGPLKDINFQKHSGAPLAVLVYIYVYVYIYIYNIVTAETESSWQPEFLVDAASWVTWLGQWSQNQIYHSPLRRTSTNKVVSWIT